MVSFKRDYQIIRVIFKWIVTLILTGMAKTIEIEVDDLNGEYEARIKQAPLSHSATSDDPMMAIRGALAVSRGHIDDYLGYERDESDSV